MPHRDQWLSRIKSVEREYLAIRQATDRFRKDAWTDPSILMENLRHAEISKASQRLEGTYFEFRRF
jgi:hypothetical protein